MRRKLSALAAAGLAALSLAACNENRDRNGGYVASGSGGSRGGDGLCTPFPGETNAAAGQTGANGAGGAMGGAMGGPMASGPMGPDGASAVDDCLHRWGYALAASPDPADQVAQAVVAACSTTLTRWNQQAMSPMGPGGGSAPQQAPSLLTGEPTNPMAERFSYAQMRALFYVVQGRAGKCRAPAMNTAAGQGGTARAY
jgi:hypothetical protein